MKLLQTLYSPIFLIWVLERLSFVPSWEAAKQPFIEKTGIA